MFSYDGIPIKVHLFLGPGTREGNSVLQEHAGKISGKNFFARKRGVKYVLFYRVITRIPGTYLTAQFFLRREIFVGPGFLEKYPDRPGRIKFFRPKKIRFFLFM